MIIAYTDGSCLSNPGLAGAAVTICIDKYRVLKHAIPIQQGTNNIAELSAVIAALTHLKEYHDLYPDKKLVLVSDSSYVLNGIRKCDYWRLPEENRVNRELWAQCYDALTAIGSTVYLYWVKGHKGFPNNEYCDQAAKVAAKTQKEVLCKRILP